MHGGTAYGAQPNIDRIADEGIRFTDYYGEQSCTVGRAAFISGQNPCRTGLTEVGMPGADIGYQQDYPTAEDFPDSGIASPPAASSTRGPMPTPRAASRSRTRAR